jgi:hypothetical protein
MNAVIVVFICHDDHSIRRALAHACSIICVGNHTISDEFRNNSNIIIARDLPYNIESEPKLLTFTAWYAIVKNRLFSGYQSVCLLEYDVILHHNFMSDLQSICHQAQEKVISFVTDVRAAFRLDTNKRTMASFLSLKNVSLQHYQLSSEHWTPTTNHCLSHAILANFVDWYYPDCLAIKRLHCEKFSWYHERLFNLYLQSIGIQPYFLPGLTHSISNSHSGIINSKTKKYVLLYEDDTHTQVRQKLIASIKAFSDFEVMVIRKSDINPGFQTENRHILQSKRGGGYWLWKPYIINTALSRIQTGDYLFYLDCNYQFVERFENLYTESIIYDDILLWSNKPNENCNAMKFYCKGDVIHKFNLEQAVYSDNALECWAGAIFIRKTPFSEAIMKKWLTMCMNYNDITDSPSVVTNPFFRDHRHDQSLLSVLVQQHNITLHHFEKKYLQNNRLPWLK